MPRCSAMTADGAVRPGTLARVSRALPTGAHTARLAADPAGSDLELASQRRWQDEIPAPTASLQETTTDCDFEARRGHSSADILFLLASVSSAVVLRAEPLASAEGQFRTVLMLELRALTKLRTRAAGPHLARANSDRWPGRTFASR